MKNASNRRNNKKRQLKKSLGLRHKLRPTQQHDITKLEPLEPRMLMSTVAFEDFDGGDVNLIAGFNPALDSLGGDSLDGGGGDFFGVGNTGNWPQSSGVPFSLADDSAVDISGGGVNAGDLEGVFGENRDGEDDFFGLSDTREWSLAQRTVDWTFNIADFDNLVLNIDFGGVSDSSFDGFGANTSVVFSVQIDGGATQTAFELTAVDFAGQFVSRAMDAGAASGGGRLLEVSGDNAVTKTLADTGAAAANTFLDKSPAVGAGAGNLDTFSTAINGTGSVLTLTMVADVPFEAMAFDNIEITGDSTGADTTAPVIALLSPADDATEVEIESNLEITFNEDVVAGSGSIFINNGGTLEIPVGDTQVSIAGNVVTINPDSDLEAETDYHITIDAGAFEDAAGNAFAGINDDTTWNFTTEVANLPPVIVENGPFQVSRNEPAGTVVGDVDADNDGQIDEGLIYSIINTTVADSMAAGRNGFEVDPIFTVGETFSNTTGALNPTTAGDYTPVGILDGLGAFKLNDSTVRILANHELLNFRGNDYEVSDGQGGTFSMSGARISYFDIDKTSLQIVDAGIAYNTIYDANGNVVSDTSFLANDFSGFSRFCSSSLFEAHQFGEGRGLEDRIYFAGEEDGGFFNSVGGGEWALDPETGDLWHVPAMGRGAWENITEVDTGSKDHVAFLLADDSSPFDFDPENDNGNEAAPMFLYVGTKDSKAKLPNGDKDFLARNGLRDGKLFVWVPDDQSMRTPAEFNTSGSLSGSWVEVDNTPQPENGSEDGSTGFDEFGFPTQGNLWLQARDLGAFGFSRPEDVSTNPNNGQEVVMASTGVDTFVDGADTFGTLYTIDFDFTFGDVDDDDDDDDKKDKKDKKKKGKKDKKKGKGDKDDDDDDKKDDDQGIVAISSNVTIIYDGDADPDRQLRSPDNLDWADDGLIYVQEDEAEEFSPSGEQLFGDDAVNPNEASILQVNPDTGEIVQVAEIDRSVILDPTIANPLDAVDVDSGAAGEWETSGILDVSTLFDKDPGTLFIFDVQAHGIEDQEDFNADSRINDGDLVEGGQLSFLKKAGVMTDFDSMAVGVNGYNVNPLLTVGETISGTTGDLNDSTAGDYTPVGVIDGLGAFELDEDTVRVLANHELLHFRGSDYEVSDGHGGTFSMSGARISYFDIDKDSRKIVDAGIAYNTIYDANGNIASDLSFLANDLAGFSRFCSSSLFEAHQFGEGRGLEDRIYFAGEEDGGFFNPVGGGEWALDPETGDLWHIPAMGRGAWENITEIDSGSDKHVAFILADDSSPFDFDPENADGNEAAPLFLYVGEKDSKAKLPNGDKDFLARNGLREGKLFVWVADDPTILTPAEFNTSGTVGGKWVEIDNQPQPENGSEDGSTGFDEFGFPTQGNLWLQAKAVGAFGFSRPEDVSTNPTDGTEIVMASTGVDTFVNGVDTFGTVYTIKTDLSDPDNPTADITIVYDGDADFTRSLRSPDNLDWADDGFIYIQEDEAEEVSPSGEPLWGEGAVNPNEAGILKLDPNSGVVTRIANIDRSVVVDPTIANPLDAADMDAGAAGEWETSGILDVSTLFGERPGSLFIFDVQAHGIEDQEDVNPDSRINDGDLVEGGQLSFLEKSPFEINPNTGAITVANPEALDEDVFRLEIQVSDGVFTETTFVDIAVNDDPVDVPTDVRVASFNASLNRGSLGELISDLSTPDDTQAQAIAQIIQINNPDIVLINEFDFDPGGVAADLFRENYLEVSQGGEDAVYYPYVYLAPSNTGVASGLDLDNFGGAGGPGDAFGFGFFEGQFAMVLFSKYEIISDQVRTFQNFLWADMPDALLPADPNDADGNGDFDNWYTAEELEHVRLSSKSHWDVPINVNGNIIHALTAHPTPPVFDGDEDRNGTRNHDEIRFWADYVTPGAGDYIYDDQGNFGGLGTGEAFVILGDYNSDPFDGDSIPGAAQQLLENPNINGSTDDGPMSLGGVEVADGDHTGDPALDTSDFGNPPGNLRVDYALPSMNLSIENSGVFWPETSDPESLLVGATDHRLVFVDVTPQAFATLHDGALVINGTNESDDIEIKRKGRHLVVEVNGNELGSFRSKDVDIIKASGLMGDDDIELSKWVRADTILRGGLGDDHIEGALFGENILLGEEGDDTLRGGFRRDILIGGADIDTLLGSLGDDLLIGGETAHDRNDASLQTVQDIWTGRGSYHKRANAIVNAGNRAGFDAGTVFDDGARDVLIGGFGRDFFFESIFDRLDDRRRERVFDI